MTKRVFQSSHGGRFDDATLNVPSNKVMQLTVEWNDKSVDAALSVAP